jgi:hypothetical protein
MRFWKPIILVLFLVWLAPRASADVTILLEEPYSYDGALAGTGHTGVYLSRICAATPTSLRRCERGENGVVLSRYHRIAGYDWIAIPLTAYLYAVDNDANVPLFANAKLESSLRDQYRRKYLKTLIPDTSSGAAPGGDWYELIGSAYDRTLYGFQLETTQKQDDDFIAKYNSQANREAYKLVSSNCADFVREAVNFYYPKAIHRSVIADLGVTTPKQVAKSMVSFSKHHPEFRFTAFVIPQVPGTIRRSKPVHGLMESVFKAKKYELTLLAFHPAVAGGFAAAYVVAGRFDPAHNALVLEPNGELDAPLDAAERRAYQKGLAEITKSSKAEAAHDKREWQDFLANAKLGLDDEGRPIMQWTTPEGTTQVGISRDNVLNGSAPPALAEKILITRLRDELSKGRAPKTSDVELLKDWKLFKGTMAKSPDDLSTRDLSDAHRISSGDN